ncbi:hypothetical protein N0V90_008026 [Kalmusia sp. IMI 367209]|nr:hypothetical protein N0V90_008026 [Kalmusia sp. IMI 367209]
MGAIGLNGFWLPELAGASNGFPIVGKSGPSQLVVYHQGGNPGTLAAYKLLPETQSAVVVGQIVLESLLNEPQKNNYLQITKDTVSRALAWYPSMHKELLENRSLEVSRDLDQYIGVYWNDVKTVHLDISLTDDSRDAIASRGRFTFQSPDYYKIKFGVTKEGKVENLTRIHEGWNLTEGETFYKADT